MSLLLFASEKRFVEETTNQHNTERVKRTFQSQNFWCLTDLQAFHRSLSLQVVQTRLVWSDLVSSSCLTINSDRCCALPLDNCVQNLLFVLRKIFLCIYRKESCCCVNCNNRFDIPRTVARLSMLLARVANTTTRSPTREMREFSFVAISSLSSYFCLFCWSSPRGWYPPLPPPPRSRPSPPSYTQNDKDIWTKIHGTLIKHRVQIHKI